jgi:aspartate aminotransferase-like enzyme
MMRRMDQNLRTPGPTPIPQEVREAQSQPMIDHRGPEFAELLRETSSGLAELIGTSGEVLPLT